MQPYFCAAMAALIVYLAAWRPVFLRKPFPVISVCLCSILLGIFGWQELRWQNVQMQGTKAVKQVSLNEEGYLRCQRLSEALFDIHTSQRGSVSFGKPKEAVVNYEECLELRSWLESGKETATPVQMQAIHVLTHEAVHVSGEYNEAVTECTAINRDTIAATALGASKSFAQELPIRYFEDYFPRMSSSYRLEGCAISPAFDSIEAKRAVEQGSAPTMP